MTHRQIATHAGVSYTTFYKHFENKEQALLGAYDAGAQRIVEAVVAAAAAAPDWPTALRDGLGAALQTLTDAPAFTRVRVIEITKLGPASSASTPRSPPTTRCSTPAMSSPRDSHAS